MGKNLYYTYDGSKALNITKPFRNIVLVEQDWIDALNQEFAANGYGRLFSGVEKTLRGVVGEQLTDAQMWLLILHMTSEGVPQALRNFSADEKSVRRTIVRGTKATVTGIWEGTKAATDVVTKPFKSSSGEENEEESEGESD